MRLTTAIKAGDTSGVIAMDMRCIAAALVEKGAQAIVAGCTEIPLVLGGRGIDVPLVSSTDVLAQMTVEIAVGLREPG